MRLFVRWLIDRGAFYIMIGVGIGVAVSELVRPSRGSARLPAIHRSTAGVHSQVIENVPREEAQEGLVRLSVKLEIPFQDISQPGVLTDRELLRYRIEVVREVGFALQRWYATEPTKEDCWLESITFAGGAQNWKRAVGEQRIVSSTATVFLGCPIKEKKEAKGGK